MSNITVNPASGLPGIPVTVTGTGFGKRQNLRLYAGSSILAAAVCDDLGTFSATVTIPANLTPGDFIVRVAAATATAAKYVVAAPPPPPSSGTTRIIMWAGAEQVCGLSDAKLDFFKAAGIGGFVCMQDYLSGMGGGNEWTTSPAADPAYPRYALQRSIVSSNIVQRCKARGINLWLGTRLANYDNHQTPLKEWFDDAGWDAILPKFTDFAAAAKMLGFVGVAFDEEMYSGGTWAWNYSGHTHAEADVRAQARMRGGQIATAIRSAFPAVDIIDYGGASLMPGGWSARVALDINHVVGAGVNNLNVEFWEGFLGSGDIGALRFWNAVFYKTWHTGSGWDEALAADKAGLRALFAQRFSAWSSVQDRVFVSAFAWIDEDVKNEGPFTAVRPVPYVNDQLAHFAKYAEGGTFGIYCYGNPANFDYGPFAPGILAASRIGASA